MQHDTYITTQKATSMLGVTAQTLRLWDSQGKIRAKRAPSGHRRYSQQDIFDILGRNPTSTAQRKIIYARVSSSKQMDDLERQKDLLRSHYPDYELVTDCGSGINWRRKGLQTILEYAMRGELSTLVVAHRDRLCRFAFELLEFIFKTTNVQLVVLHNDIAASGEQELADDILSIVQVYACRKMGRRRYMRPQATTLSDHIASSNLKEMDGDGEGRL